MQDKEKEVIIVQILLMKIPYQHTHLLTIYIIKKVICNVNLRIKELRVVQIKISAKIGTIRVDAATVLRYDIFLSFSYFIKCKFIHVTNKLFQNTNAKKYKTKPCFHYHEKGFCLRGENCKFIHNECSPLSYFFDNYEKMKHGGKQFVQDPLIFESYSTKLEKLENDFV